MSERAEVEVFFPLTREPDKLEQMVMVRQAFDHAKKLVAPGRVLGLTKVIGAVHPDTGQPALKIRFAVEAPESLQARQQIHATR